MMRNLKTKTLYQGKRKGYYFYSNYGKKVYIKNPSEEQLRHVEKDPYLPSPKEKKVLPSTLFDFLPRDILFLILLKIKPEDLPSTFDITEKFLKICQDPHYRKMHRVYWKWKEDFRYGDGLHLIVGKRNSGTSQYLLDLIYPLEREIASLPNNKEAIEDFVRSLSPSFQKEVVSAYEKYVDARMDVIWRKSILRIFIEHLISLDGCRHFDTKTPYDCLEKILRNKDAFQLYGKTIKDIPISLEDLSIDNLAHLFEILQISIPSLPSLLTNETSICEFLDEFLDAVTKKFGKPFVPLDLVADSLCRLEE